MSIKDEKQSQRIAFIFDLDGTLLNSMDLFLKTIPLRITAQFKIDFTPQMAREIEDLIYSIFSGKHSSGGKLLIFKMLVRSARIFGIPWYKWGKYLKYYEYHYKKEIPQVNIIAGSREMLDHLVEEYNILLGISTTASEEEILDRFKNKMSFLDRFNGAILGRDSVRYSKPSPEGIFILTEKWGISPQRCVMIGDFDADIEAGKAAGAITIGVLTGFSTRKMMERNNPDYILNNVSEIPSILDEILVKVNRE
ncbi:MAG: HAD family hydrolase [Promethearchaeota archaeon]